MRKFAKITRMNRFFTFLITTFIYIGGCLTTSAQTYPTIDPTGTYTDSEGTETVLHGGESYSGSAPLTVRFEANASDADGWTAHYEWRFYTEEDQTNPYLTRYEQDTEYAFTNAGSHRIRLYATFTQGSDIIEYTDDYWHGEGQPIIISISESKLEMPNAFSPNDDGINDYYAAKGAKINGDKATGQYQSIVEFKATIYNRWGTKLYEWSDIDGGWDGKYNGKPVAQGVYFVQVHARGADGRVFNIRRDVNLLRGYTESTTTTTE